MKTIVIIPAYNEEITIGEVVDSVRKFDFISEVAVVDDGSSDQTGKRAQACGATVLRHAINRGYGAALTTGTRYALKQGAEIIVYFDADGQFAASEIEGMINALRQKEADVIFGSRFLDKKSNVPLFRFLSLKIAILFNRLVTGVCLSDAHNGFRVLHRRAAQTISMKQERMAYCTEMLAEIRRAGLKYAEFPITVRYTEYSLGKGKGSFSIASKVIKDLLTKKLFDLK